MQFIFYFLGGGWGDLGAGDRADEDDADVEEEGVHHRPGPTHRTRVTSHPCHKHTHIKGPHTTYTHTSNPPLTHTGGKDPSHHTHHSPQPFRVPSTTQTEAGAHPLSLSGWMLMRKKRPANLIDPCSSFTSHRRSVRARASQRKLDRVQLESRDSCVQR